MLFLCRTPERNGCLTRSNERNKKAADRKERKVKFRDPKNNIIVFKQHRKKRRYLQIYQENKNINKNKIYQKQRGMCQEGNPYSTLYIK